MALAPQSAPAGPAPSDLARSIMASTLPPWSLRLSIAACRGQRTLVVPKPQAITVRKNSPASPSARLKTNSRRIPSCRLTSRSSSACSAGRPSSASGHGAWSRRHRTLWSRTSPGWQRRTNPGNGGTSTQVTRQGWRSSPQDGLALCGYGSCGRFRPRPDVPGRRASEHRIAVTSTRAKMGQSRCPHDPSEDGPFLPGRQRTPPRRITIRRPRDDDVPADVEPHAEIARDTRSCLVDRLAGSPAILVQPELPAISDPETLGASSAEKRPHRPHEPGTPATSQVNHLRRPANRNEQCPHSTSHVVTTQRPPTSRTLAAHQVTTDVPHVTQHKTRHPPAGTT